MISRLDKFLTDAGVGSRSQVKNIIKKGFVTVDGTVIRDEGSKSDYSLREVKVNGEIVVYERFRYYMLNKPSGVVSATRDNLSDTVIEILKNENTKGLFPVGRLDKDTEGLLLITNDGELAHNLLSPKKHVEKCYFVRLDKPLNEEDRLAIEDCIDIGDDKPCLPASVEYARDGAADMIESIDFAKHEVYITISEGRYHQVKRMFAARGYEVQYLKRIRMGRLVLDDDIPVGSYKVISREDIIS